MSQFSLLNHQHWKWISKVPRDTMFEGRLRLLETSQETLRYVCDCCFCGWVENNTYFILNNIFHMHSYYCQLILRVKCKLSVYGDWVVYYQIYRHIISTFNPKYFPTSSTPDSKHRYYSFHTFKLLTLETWLTALETLAF